MSKIRAMLYVCAWSAKKCNKSCKELYDRLVEKGKSKKQNNESENIEMSMQN